MERDVPESRFDSSPPADCRMPAEWSNHAATWLSWPHNRETWPVQMAETEAAFCAMVAALAPVEKVRVNVLDADHRRHVSKLLAATAPPEQIEFHLIPTDDAWVRDHGAIFVTSRQHASPLVALDFDYNAWGGKYPPYDNDRRVARAMARALDVPVWRSGYVLEGGSIDVNGSGLLMTTEQCLLNPNRNPDASRGDIESLLTRAFGVAEIIWLGDGIEGDDTDGHIDDLTRFVDDRSVVTVVEPNRDDPNHAPLAANLERLMQIELADGSNLDVIELPMPEPVWHGDQRLPASYANFYIANEIVLMPAFAQSSDARALCVLADCLPGRRIIPIDARALVAGLGAVHCLTQQVPAIVADATIS
jgi:agmatine deiminase